MVWMVIGFGIANCIVFPEVASAQACGTSSAKPRKIDTLIDLSLENLLTIQVTTASKKEEPWFDAPSSMTVFTREQIQAMGVDSVEELLNFVPGFDASREAIFGAGYRVAARGRSTPQASFDILFLRDGRRLNADRSGGALSYHHLISLHNVRQVEVIRGPGSALYGTNAFSGVVNIITLDCANSHRELYLGGGNLGRREGYFNGFHHGQDWELALSGRYLQEDGDRYPDPFHPGETVRDPRLGQEVSLRARYQKFRLDAQYLHHQLEDFYVGHYSSQNERNFSEFNQYFWDLEYDAWSQRDRELTLRAGYNWRDNWLYYESLDRDSVRETLSDPTAHALVIGNTGEEEEWYAGIDGRYRANARNEWFIGIEWRRPDNRKSRSLTNYFDENLLALMNDRVPSTAQYLGGALYEGMVVTKETSREILGVYLQDKIQFNDRWQATLGLRHDQYSDFGSTTNPRLAVLHRFGANTRFKLLYGRAFRAPSFRQLGSFLGNPELQPERVETLETAWIQDFSGGYTVLTWFLSRYQDIIDTQLLPSGARRFMNLEGSAFTRGWEFETAFALGQRASLRAGYTYLNATEENPRRFPRHGLSWVLDYRQGPWHAGLSGFHHGNVEQLTLSGIRKIEEYWMVNASLRHQLNRRVELTAIVQNLLDEDYYSTSRAPRFDPGLPNQGRTWRLGLTYRF